MWVLFNLNCPLSIEYCENIISKNLFLSEVCAYCDYNNCYAFDAIEDLCGIGAKVYFDSWREFNQVNNYSDYINDTICSALPPVHVNVSTGDKTLQDSYLSTVNPSLGECNTMNLWMHMFSNCACCIDAIDVPEPTDRTF